MKYFRYYVAKLRNFCLMIPCTFFTLFLYIAANKLSPSKAAILSNYPSFAIFIQILLIKYKINILVGGLLWKIVANILSETFGIDLVLDLFKWYTDWWWPPKWFYYESVFFFFNFYCLWSALKNSRELLISILFLTKE